MSWSCLRINSDSLLVVGVPQYMGTLTLSMIANISSLADKFSIIASMTRSAEWTDSVRLVVVLSRETASRKNVACSLGSSLNFRRAARWSFLAMKSLDFRATVSLTSTSVTLKPCVMAVWGNRIRICLVNVLKWGLEFDPITLYTQVNLAQAPYWVIFYFLICN